MPLPPSYSETDLAVFMRDGVLGSTAIVLGLENIEDGRFVEAVNSAQLAAGESATIERLRAYAAVEAWRLASSEAAGDYSYSEDGTSYNRQQVFEHCQQMFEQAVAAVDQLNSSASASGSGGGVRGQTRSVRVKAVW